MKKIKLSFLFAFIFVLVTISAVRAEIFMGWWTDLANSDSWSGYKDTPLHLALYQVRVSLLRKMCLS
jgi:hypothetical protein